VLADVRGELFPEPPVGPARTPRRRRRRWLTAGAAAAVLACAAVVSQTLPGTDPTQQTALAAETLNRAANLVADRPDAPVGRGRYRYIRTHAWNMGGGDGGPPVAVLQESVREIWKPARWTGEWLQRDTITGRRRVIMGTEAQARAAGLLEPVPEPHDLRAPRSTRHGDWESPTPHWMASLPRDPKQLYERLSKDALFDEHGTSHIVTTAADALRTGLLPADLRAALYRALTYTPGLEVTERAANLDGATGTALGISSERGTTRQDIILDPATGQFIGEREVVVKAAPGQPKPGTVITSTSVTTAVADRRGVAPDA
jgi:hypothetical protein